MARRTTYQSKSYPITATTAQNITIASSDLPSDKLVALHFVYVGAGNIFSDLTRIRVNANGTPIINLLPNQLRAYLEAFTRSNFALATTATRWTIPFFMPDADNMAEADLCQFPRRSACEVILSIGTGSAAGSLYFGWTESNVEPVVSPSLVSSVMNIATGQALAKYNFQSEGIVRGLALPTAGVQRLKIVVAGETVKESAGPDFLATTTGDMNIEQEALEGVGVTVTDPIFSKITTEKQAPLNSSFIELETHASNWAGVSNELAIYSLHPNGLRSAA